MHAVNNIWQIKQLTLSVSLPNFQAFAALDAKKSGRDAKTVVREKGTGKIRDLEADKKEKEEKEKKEAERKAKYERWGKGIAQGKIHILTLLTLFPIFC